MTTIEVNIYGYIALIIFTIFSVFVNMGVLYIIYLFNRGDFNLDYKNEDDI